MNTGPLIREIAEDVAQKGKGFPQRRTLFRWLQIVGFKAIGITLGLALIAGWVMEWYW